MPRPDPIPSPPHCARRRFFKAFRLLALLAMVIAALAVVLVSRGDPHPMAHLHMLIATALGSGLTILVGAGLMTLAFISNSSGYDEAAANFQQKSDSE